MLQPAAPLPLPPAPPFAGHQLRRRGAHIQRGPGIQKQRACTAGQDVLHGAREFVTNRPYYFRAGVREGGVKGSGEGCVVAHQAAHRGRVGTVHGERAEFRGARVEAMDIEVLRSAGPFRQARQGGSLIDAVFRHVPAGTWSTCRRRW